MRHHRLSTMAATLGTLGAAVVVAGCGSLTASSSSAGNATPTPGLAKPASAGQAVSDAIARVAHFTDVTYQQSNIITAGGQSTMSSGTISATANPPRVDIRTQVTSGTAKSFETVEDLGAGTLCTTPQGGTTQRYTAQSTNPAVVDPFYDISSHGSGWHYLDDVTLSGARAWDVRGQLARSFTDATVDSSMVDLFIDSTSGKIVKVVSDIHFTATATGAHSENQTTYTNFVYNTGLTIPAC